MEWPVMDIKLLSLTSDDREQFILDNQEAFSFAALEAFGSTYDYKITDEDEIDGMFVLRKAVI